MPKNIFKGIISFYKAPYNKTHPVKGFLRLCAWWIIRLCKLTRVKYRFWDNRFLYIDYNSFHCMWAMYNYIVDWEEFNAIKDFLQADDIAFDVGSNMGYYTVWMSKFIKSGKIYSFEPDERNFLKLTKNIVLNKIGNRVVTNKIALSDADGSVLFSNGLDGENHIIQTASSAAILIKSQTLSSYCHQYGIIIYITLNLT